MKMRTHLLTALWFSGVLAACSPREDPEGKTPDASTPDATTRYEAVGVVTNIMANRRFLVIDHEAIPGFMDAMTMPFAVKDTTLLSGLAAGDSVSFQLAATPGEVYIQQIERIGAGR